MTKQEILAELRLFKSYTVNFAPTKEICLEKGVLFPDGRPNEVVKEYAIELYGKDGEKWNQTFHKSFSTVRDLPIETLLAQQLTHYFTTYGLENLGFYNEELVYIPHENLEIPELEEDVPIIVIKYIDEMTLNNKLMNLLKSGIALSEQTIEDIMILSKYIDKNRFDEIKNREIKIALYDKYDVVPRNNIEFLKYLIYVVTDKTLLIQNDDTIKEIKNSTKLRKGQQLIINYVKANPSNINYLAEIFLRFKGQKDINKIINRISKLSKIYHKPLEKNILDNLSQIHSTVILDLKLNQIIEELNKVTIFREIRILNGLKYRLEFQDEPIVYKIRNGKAYVENLSSMIGSKYTAQYVLINNIKRHLITRLRNIIKGKKIYIPKNVVYMAPSSEKQFIGNIPEGSFITVDRDDNMIVGIHWFNKLNERVDLDLHMMNRNEQYGWNTAYRSSWGEDFYFSGDVTDAPKPNGATECFYIGKNCINKSFLLTLNDYTKNSKPVDFDFVIAKCGSNEINRSYVINPNNILVQIQNKMTENEMTLGLVKIIDKKIEFYFNDFNLGKSIATRRSDTNKNVFEYLNNYSKIQLTLNELLEESGAILLDVPYSEELVESGTDSSGNTLYKKEKISPDIDLSLENIDKTTIINLFNS